MNTRKDVKKLLKQLRKDGYEIDEHSKHYKVIDRDGAVLFGISRTPSDVLAWRRILADCRGAGILER